MTRARYAIYYAPAPDSALWRLGCRWLGRDATGAAVAPRPLPDGLDADRAAAVTALPRRYGFHATLKAPFRLAPATTPEMLVGALDAFAAARAPFAAPPLAVGALAGFLALRPTAPSAALAALADDCVRDFDRFRAPADAAETARRGAGLGPRQKALLAAWGYAYVFDAYRFHLTLTGRLAEAERDRLAAVLGELFAPVLAEPLTVDAICLFHEAAPGAPLALTHRFAFGAR